MASVGPAAITSGANLTGIGTVAWSNPGNVTASDDVRATAVLDPSGGTSNYLVMTGCDFSAIPDSATIDGVEANAEFGCSGNSMRDDEIVLVVGGTPVGTSQERGAIDWNTPADAVVVFGGSTNMWGAGPLTGADVKTDFGFAMVGRNVHGSSARTARVDYATMTVYYTEAAGSGPLLGAHRNRLVRPA